MKWPGAYDGEMPAIGITPCHAGEIAATFLKQVLSSWSPVRAFGLYLGLFCLLAGAAGRAHAQVSIPPGYELIPIATHPGREFGPSINNKGQVVFVRRVDPDVRLSDEIFLWDCGRLQRITNDSVRQTFPDINGSGVIVFDQVQPANEGSDVIRYENGRHTVIAHEEGVFQSIVSINNPGDMIWEKRNDGNCGAATDIMLYSNGVTTQVTFNELSNQWLHLNDQGTIVWGQFDWCIPLRVTTIWQWSPARGARLIAEGPEDLMEDLNQAGDVLFQRNDFLWLYRSDTSESSLIAPGPGIREAAFNDREVVAYAKSLPGESEYSTFWACDGQSHQITRRSNGSVHELDVNQLGNAVIRISIGTSGAADIWLLRRTSIAGDIDGDRDVDLNDASILQICLGKTVAAAAECSTADLDRDGLIDDADAATLLMALQGPKHAGDVTYDGHVDLADYFELQRCFGLPSCANPDCWDADLNQDGQVDGADMQQWTHAVAER